MTELKPVKATSDSLFYDHMESQSGRCLAVIYRPFDPDSKWDWSDRGHILDYLHATRAEGTRVLDFGPGDGWPSLHLAKWASEVVGVDASARRVEECRRNAERLGTHNAKFVKIGSDCRLPFEDCVFDAATAASSVEQTPDPLVALSQIRRVLRPGGRLRIHYEALSGYAGRAEHDVWLIDQKRDGAPARLVIYARDIEGEKCMHFSIDLDMAVQDVVRSFIGGAGGTNLVRYEHVTVERLQALRGRITGAMWMELSHPSGGSMVSLLRQAGFTEVIPSESGGRAALKLFNSLSQEQRPRDIDGIDRLLTPAVQEALSTVKPPEEDPMITAVK